MTLPLWTDVFAESLQSPIRGVFSLQVAILNKWSLQLLKPVFARERPSDVCARDLICETILVNRPLVNLGHCDGLHEELSLCR